MSLASSSSGSQPNVPTTANTDLRSRVVEILAATANGCLTELGYYPGMPQRMIELERLNAKWQSENVKLFQDNQKLSRLLRERERSMLINGSDDQKIKSIQALEEQIRGFKEERVNLIKQNEAYRRMYSDYVKTSEFYRGAVHEIDQLRKYIQRLTSIQQPLHASRQVTNNQAVSAPLQVSQLYQVSQAQHGQWPLQTAPPQNITPSNGLPTENPTVSTSQRGTPETMVQTSIAQNHLVPMIRQAVLTNQMSQQHSSTLVHSQIHIDGSPDTSSRPSSQRTSQPPLTVDTSLEIRSHLPTPSSGIATLPQHGPYSTSSSAGSTPLPLTAPTTACPETNNQATLIDQSQAVTSVNVLVDGCDNPVDLIRQTSADQPSNNAASPSYALPPGPSPDALKRASVNISGDLSDEAQQRKKPRFESQDNGTERVEGQAAVSGMSVETDSAFGLEEDEESDDGVIEIGPDGLRLEDDCLAALIEEVGTDEDLKVCNLCNARFENGYATERPQPFVNATKEELLRHCSTEHHDAWEELRHHI